jgi:drug/metabolite transporter (DMT)-like permease
LLAAATEDVSTLSSAGARNVLIGVISGLIPIALAHPAFHYAQRNLGSAFCSSVALFNPFVTYLIALFIFPDERLILTQWFGAGILVIGTLMVVYTGRKE